MPVLCVIEDRFGSIPSLGPDRRVGDTTYDITTNRADTNRRGGDCNKSSEVQPSAIGVNGLLVYGRSSIGKSSSLQNCGLQVRVLPVVPSFGWSLISKLSGLLSGSPGLALLAQSGRAAVL